MRLTTSRATTFAGLVGAFALTTIALAGPPHSVARQWNDELLDAIRRDFARPTVHARNLYHVSAAMWDAWAAYDDTVDGVIADEYIIAVDIQAERHQAISFAAYRVLTARFATSPGAVVSQASFDALMANLGYDKNNTSVAGDTPAAVGNRCAAAVLAFGATDGSNEANGYENQFYAPVNDPLIPAFPGNPTIDFPNRWQPLSIDFIDQGGNPIPTGYPDFLSPEWGQVTPFSLKPEDATIYQRDGFDYWVYHDPGPPPLHNGAGDDYYRWGFEMVSMWSSHLDPTDGVMWDVSPNAIGNAPLVDPSEYATFYDRENGGDASACYTLNPVTGLPYPTQFVPRGDYTRILAEFWADGPDSETPPGHWFTILNYVSDHPDTVKQLGGVGPVLSDLEWDLKCYLALGGAMHDVAIACWGTKGWYDYIRPISAIRYLTDEGQSSDPGDVATFDPDGIRLVPDFIEVVTAASTMPGQRHEHLLGEEGKIAVKAWRGPDAIGDPETDTAGVDWILAENWWSYQRPTFVTPPFAGYTSGHSTYSRAAAELMALLTGSPYFPGGLGEFECPQDSFLVFEEGPSVNVTLQWASYVDASDQCSLSRIWGGIHPPADDLPGRHMGKIIGPDAFCEATRYYSGQFTCPADTDGSGTVDVFDLLSVLSRWDTDHCNADIDRSGAVNVTDLLALLAAWGACGE